MSFWHVPSITTHWCSGGKSLHPPQDTLLAGRGKSVRVRRLIMVRAMNETPGAGELERGSEPTGRLQQASQRR